MTTQQPDGQPQTDDVIGADAPVQGSPVKDPDQWVTGDEPMTASQRSYLETLAREAGETLPGDLTKAQASEHIDRLQSVTGRGQGNAPDGAAGGAAPGADDPGPINPA